jgi:hypothetical protein
MKRNKGIIAYGTDLDRDKLRVLAEFSGCTASDFLIRLIRSQYSEGFGDADPKCIIPQHR